MNKEKEPCTVSDLNKKREELKKEKNLNPDGEFSFEEILRRNKEKDDKLKNEREGANKKVKRDYRL